MKKQISLIKNFGVTFIILIGESDLLGFMFEALVVRKSTTEQIKKVPPIKIETA